MISVPLWLLPPAALVVLAIAAFVAATRTRGQLDLGGGFLFLIALGLLLGALLWLTAYGLGARH